MPIGCNIRLSELQALMIYSVVNDFKKIISNKTEIGEKYEEICKSNEIEFISQKLNSNIGNFYKFTIISPKEKVLEKYPTIKTTTSKVYDYALGGNKDIPSKHLCLPIWYGLEKNVVDKVINELKR